MTTTDDQLRSAVRDRYARIAVDSASCCGEPAAAAPPAETQSCCNDTAGGYDAADIASLPDEAVMGLGCGNPVGLAGLTPGETVVDLGSGGGIDVFLAARRVGDSGRAIGVDMTPEMVARARENADRAGIDNVEFRSGLIEDLPIDDASVDVVLSNCVINLAPDKAPVFAEAFRVLRPGGRIMVSDIVAARALPKEIAADPDRWAACIGGAMVKSDYLATIAGAGFGSIEIVQRSGHADGLMSITVRAVKPG